nr:hypothetical protein FVER53263_20500 [Fusarium verticillioides]
MLRAKWDISATPWSGISKRQISRTTYLLYSRLRAIFSIFGLIYLLRRQANKHIITQHLLHRQQSAFTVQTTYPCSIAESSLAPRQASPSSAAEKLRYYPACQIATHTDGRAHATYHVGGHQSQLKRGWLLGFDSTLDV